MLHQQGDVLLETVSQIPLNSQRVPKTDGRHVLARGEATGHAHAVADDVEVLQAGSRLFCRAAVPFTVTHEEHRPISIPPGLYEVRRVRVYDHFSEEVLEASD